MEYWRIFTVPTFPDLAYYSSLVVYERPGTAAVWIVAGIEFVTMALVRFHLVAHGDVVRFY